MIYLIILNVQIVGKKYIPRYYGLKIGYKNIFCSSKCSANFNLTKERKEKTNLSKYGTKHSVQNEEVKQKRKQNYFNKTRILSSLGKSRSKKQKKVKL